MERNKLETQFKEQLDSREIKPSEMAWDKLDAMLTVAEKQKQRFPLDVYCGKCSGFSIYWNSLL